jgi:hypothetical protein
VPSYLIDVTVDATGSQAYGPAVRTALTAIASFCLVLTGAGMASASGAPAHVGPGQHFKGIVNGASGSPVVYTICPGPATPGRTGPVEGGQTFAIAKAASGHGYTGSFAQVYAWFVPNAAVNGPLQVTLRNYGAAKAIPSAARVPCDGQGRVEFSSCPYLAPCAAGWVPAYVDVRFVDIAA